MSHVTLTTVVKNCLTLPLLLKMTDELFTSGTLHSLRIIDKTGNSSESAYLRSMIPVDGETGTQIVTLDLNVLKEVDPNANVNTGMTGYRYKTTNLCLSPSSPPVYVVCRGTAGSFIAVSPVGKSTGGVEVGLEKTNCYIRSGRGGGEILANLGVPGIVAGGTAWRSIKLWIDSEKNLHVQLDNDATMSHPLKIEEPQLVISVSSPAGGLSDFVVSYKNPSQFKPVSNVNREYVSYYSSPPISVRSGIEVVSNFDIVYIEKDGWERIANGQGVPLVVGDLTYLNTLRRIGVLRQSNTSKEVHKSFLDRSRRIIDLTNFLADEGIKIAIQENSGIKTNYDSDLAKPSLFCALDSKVINDLEILEGYKRLIQQGVSGEKISSFSIPVLAYLDAILNSSGTEEFLLELVEALPKDKKDRLFQMLSQ